MNYMSECASSLRAPPHQVVTNIVGNIDSVVERGSITCNRNTGNTVYIIDAEKRKHREDARAMIHERGAFLYDNESRGYSNYPETRYGVRKINDRRVYYVTSRANVPRLYQC